MKKIIGFFLVILASIILWQCASQTTPGGGPKDETPPKLKKSIPLNNQTAFKGKSVELTFDELLKLNNAKEEIIITPSPGKDITFSVKSNRVMITPKQGWKDSTTYSISFREGIQDLNEGNPAKDLHLAFSTGPIIDTLQITGKISESFSEKIPENITVALYQEDTFNIFQNTPAYFTKTKKDGNFKIENLKHGGYFIYAFEDKNKNLKVESTSEKFGFLPTAVSSHLQEKKKIKDTLSIALYKVDSRPLKINSIRTSGISTKIKFNKNLLQYSLENPTHTKIYHSFTDKQTEVTIFNQLDLNDSVRITIHGQDSIDFKKDSTFYIKRLESKQEKDKFSFKIISGAYDPTTLTVNVIAQFSKPILQTNLDSVYLTTDNLPIRIPKEKPTDKKKNPKKNIERPDKPIQKKDTTKVLPITKILVLKENISIDSVKRTVEITKQIDKKQITEKVKQINIAFEDLFILSIDKDSSKRETKSIPIVTEETTGTLYIEVSTKYKNYEIRLLGPSNEIVQKVRNVKKYTFKFLQAQEYKLMTYADLNNNGKWDCQNITLQTIQEPTFFYTTPEGKFTFPIRTTWEVGPLQLKF